MNFNGALGDICDISSGGTPSRSKPEYYGGAIPWTKIGDFEGRETIFDTEEHLTEAGLAAIRGKRFPKGTLLFAIYGSMGKMAFAGSDIATNQAILGIQPKKPNTVCLRYVYHYLGSRLTEMIGSGRGVTQKNLSAGYLRTLEIDLPHYEEQRRIAAILDKADAIRSKREQALTLADDFLRSVFLEMFGRPGQPNPSLPTEELGQICDLFAGNSLPIGATFNGEEHGLLLLKVGDMNLPGNEDVVQVAREWIDEDRVTGPAIRAPKDAIVFPKRGGAIATNKKRVLGRDCILDPNLMAVAPKAASPISFQFLRVWFDLLDLSTLSNGSTVPQLNKGDLKPLELPIPRPNDLIAFDRIFGSVTRVRQRLADDLSMSESLFGALSQRAFSGDL